jgi:hypothetical protein
MLDNIFNISYYNILKFLDIKSIINLKKSNIYVFNNKYIKNILYKKCYSIFYRYFKKYIGYIHILSNETIKFYLFVNDNNLLKKLRGIYYYRYYPRHLIPIYMHIGNNYIIEKKNNDNNIYNSYQLFNLIKQLNLVDIIEIGW